MLFVLHNILYFQSEFCFNFVVVEYVNSEFSLPSYSRYIAFVKRSSFHFLRVLRRQCILKLRIFPNHYISQTWGDISNNRPKSLQLWVFLPGTE